MEPETIRTLILIIGWPMLIAGAFLFSLQAFRFYKKTNNSVLGKMLLGKTAGILGSMFALGTVSTFFMFDSVNKGVKVVLPVFSVWLIIMIYTYFIFQKMSVEAIKINELSLNAIRSEKVLSMVGQSVLAFDEKGAVTYINPHASLTLDAVSSEVIGKQIDDIVTFTLSGKKPLEKGIITKSVLELKKPFSSSNYKETLFVSVPEGQKFPVVLTATLAGVSDVSEGGIIIFRDITHEEEMRLALAQERNKLAESNKLKDLFMDIMRHDLLNPAGIVRMNSQLVLEQEKDAEKKKPLEAIERQSNRMIAMIQNASILAKLESGEKIEFKKEDMGVVLKGSVEELYQRAKAKNMKITVNAEGKFPAIVNPLIQNIFSNFISNAIKYSPEKTEIVAGIKKKGEDWLVYVEDRGEGVPAKYKKSIFERFTRLEKGAVKGSGLGLAISKKIIEAHNSKIWVEDHKEGGSVFYVLIPKVRKKNVKSVVKKVKSGKKKLSKK